jgi:hypothetical protein
LSSDLLQELEETIKKTTEKNREETQHIASGDKPCNVKTQQDTELSEETEQQIAAIRNNDFVSCE